MNIFLWYIGTVEGEECKANVIYVYKFFLIIM